MLQFGKYFWEYSVVKNILFNFDVEQVGMSKIEKENLGRDRFIFIYIIYNPVPKNI